MPLLFFTEVAWFLISSSEIFFTFLWTMNLCRVWFNHNDMSATLHFIDNSQTFCHPWKCQCVRRLSEDPFERAYGFLEECGCPDADCNMSNSNTRAVLAALGLPTDFDNSPAMLPQELHAATQRFLNSDIAEVVDGGTEDEVTGGDGSATMISCGREVGYLTSRVMQIADLCERAMLAGATRCYFA